MPAAIKNLFKTAKQQRFETESLKKYHKKQKFLNPKKTQSIFDGFNENKRDIKSRAQTSIKQNKVCEKKNMGLGRFELPTARTPSVNHTKLDYSPLKAGILCFAF